MTARVSSETEAEVKKLCFALSRPGSTVSVSQGAGALLVAAVAVFNRGGFQAEDFEGCGTMIPERILEKQPDPKARANGKAARVARGAEAPTGERTVVLDEEETADERPGTNGSGRGRRPARSGKG